MSCPGQGKKLNAGNSEIRNWIAAGATEHLVAYLLATDNVLRSLACRLSQINQSVLRSCNPFSRPHRTRSACL
jgi:hypothetical protein